MGSIDAALPRRIQRRQHRDGSQQRASASSPDCQVATNPAKKSGMGSRFTRETNAVSDAHPDGTAKQMRSAGPR